MMEEQIVMLNMDNEDRPQLVTLRDLLALLEATPNADQLIIYKPDRPGEPFAFKVYNPVWDWK